MRGIRRLKRLTGLPPKPPTKRRPPKTGGSEPVTVVPDRPLSGEGGAAAPLEYDLD